MNKQKFNKKQELVFDEVDNLNFVEGFNRELMKEWSEKGIWDFEIKY